MDVETAISLVNESLVFLPTWELAASDYRHRFEDAICLRVVIHDALRSERELAPVYPETVPNGAKSEFVIQVGDIDSIEDLVGLVLDSVLDTFQHEAREFMRVQPSMWAPFHPHKQDGIKRWSERTGRHPEQDYKYGII